MVRAMAILRVEPFDSVPFEAIAALVRDNASTVTDQLGFHPSVEELRHRAATVEDPDKAVWLRDGAVEAWAVVEARFSNLLFGQRQPSGDGGQHPLAFGRQRLLAHGARHVRTPLVDGEAWREALLRDQGFAPADHVTRHEARLEDVRLGVVDRLPDGARIEPLADRVEEYVALHRRGFGASYLTVERRRDWMKRPDYRPDLDLCVADSAGRLMGAAVSYLEGSAVYLAVVVVDPEQQGRGLARALTTETVRRARAAGARELASTTGAPPLRHLLEGLGVPAVATTHWWQCALPVSPDAR
jgi:ribosomal protein S18 acetylase RimI-like enzyme